MQAFFPGNNTQAVLASNILGQLTTSQYGTGSVTNDVLAGGISIDKLAAFGKAGQLIQSTGNGEMAITPPQIFSNIDESGLVNSGIVYGDSINGYSIMPINPMIASYIASQQAVLESLTLDNYSLTNQFQYAHGLGTVPFAFRVTLKCNNVTGSSGYPYNREIQLDNTGTSDVTISYDSQYVYANVKAGAVIEVTTPSGTTSAITLSDWKLEFYLSL